MELSEDKKKQISILILSTLEFSHYKMRNGVRHMWIFVAIHNIHLFISRMIPQKK